MKKKSFVRAMLSGVLATAVFIPSLVQPTQTYAAPATAESYVKGLSVEDRQSLKRLDSQLGFVVDPRIKKQKGQAVNIIAELNTSPISLNKDGKTIAKESNDKIKKEQEFFKKRGKELYKEKKYKEEFKVGRTFQTVFNGVTMTIHKSQIDTLLETGVVKRIWLNEEIELSPIELKEAKSSSNIPAPLPHIGVDKLHSEGIDGKGIKVGVLDTGIDYNHPDLKDVYKGGYDAFDNDSDPMETTPEDWKKLNGNTPLNPEFLTEHGTHVAGTIASNPKNKVDYAMTGVAPKADLYAYRVLGPYGRGDSATIIGGIERAVADGMDIINLSLGSAQNFSLTAESIAINNAALNGVIPVIAAGNAGDREGTLGSPGTSSLGITVGASDVPTEIATAKVTYNNSLSVNLSLLEKNLDPLPKDLAKEYKIVSVGLGTEAEYANVDVKGKAVLIKRGGGPLSTTVERASKKGAAIVLLYNNEPGQVPYYLGDNPGIVPSFKLTKEEGDKLAEAIKGKVDQIISLSDVVFEKTIGDELADFSSRGPVTDNFAIKPDIVGPGVAVLSTVPEFITSPEEGVDYSKSYMSLSGTSMASPHVAGVAALIVQAHPEYKNPTKKIELVEKVKASLMNTADKLSKEYNVNEVGAGRVDAYEAVHTNGLVQVLGKTKTMDASGNIVTIDDIGGSYSAGSFYPGQNTKKMKVQFTNTNKQQVALTSSIQFTSPKGVIKDGNKNGVKVEVPQTITVAGSGKSTFDVTITVPSSAEKGHYQGYIYLKEKDNEYQIPFQLRYTDKGIDHVTLDRLVTSNLETAGYPFVGGAIQLKSEMKTIDVVIKDLNGKPLGIAGTIDATYMGPDSEYGFLSLFSGWIRPFTGKVSAPIGREFERVPEGKYLISIIGTDSSGKTYSLDEDMVIDNTPPTVTFDRPLGPNRDADKKLTTEVLGNNSYEAYWVHGKVYDETMDYLYKRGHKEYNQSYNYVTLYQDSWFPTALVGVNEKGDFKFGVSRDEFAGKISSISLDIGETSSTSIPDRPTFAIIESGQPYVHHQSQGQRVYLNKEVSDTVTINNVKQMTSATVSVDLVKGYLKLSSVKPSKQLTDLANKNNWGIRVSKEANLTDQYVDTHKFTVDIWDKKTKLAVKLTSKSINLLDVKAKLVRDDYYEPMSLTDIYTVNASYRNYGGDTIKTPQYYDTFKVVPKTSYLEGYILGEASKTFLENPNLDYSTIGAKVWIEDKSGKKYKAKIEDYGFFTLSGIPAVNKKMTLVVDIPGHFQYRKAQVFSAKDNGEVIGMWDYYYMDTTAAGDVNKDHVIDIYDAKRIADNNGATGTYLREDLNFDGVVNKEDFDYVVKNFLTSNPYLPAGKTPVAKTGKITLDSLKERFK